MMDAALQLYKRPAGLSLFFCSRKEIEAAPREEREAYYRLVNHWPDHVDINAIDAGDPVNYRALNTLTDEQHDDNMEAIRNGDSAIY